MIKAPIDDNIPSQTSNKHSSSQIDAMLGMPKFPRLYTSQQASLFSTFSPTEKLNFERQAMITRVAYLEKHCLSTVFPMLCRVIGQEFKPNMSSIEPATCKFCNKEFKSSCHLGGHMARHHKKEREELKKKLKDQGVGKGKGKQRVSVVKIQEESQQVRQVEEEQQKLHCGQESPQGPQQLEQKNSNFIGSSSKKKQKPPRQTDPSPQPQANPFIIEQLTQNIPKRDLPNSKHDSNETPNYKQKANPKQSQQSEEMTYVKNQEGEVVFKRLKKKMQPGLSEIEKVFKKAPK